MAVGGSFGGIVLSLVCAQFTLLNIFNDFCGWIRFWWCYRVTWYEVLLANCIINILLGKWKTVVGFICFRFLSDFYILILSLRKKRSLSFFVNLITCNLFWASFVLLFFNSSTNIFCFSRSSLFLSNLFCFFFARVFWIWI